MNDRAKIVALQIALRDLLFLIAYGHPDEIHMAAPDVRAAIEIPEATK